MTKLITKDYALQLLPCLATQIGVSRAIVLQQLYWLLGQRKMGRKKDGVKYIRMTVAEWQERHFPFMSRRNIRRVLASLERDKLVISRQDLNRIGYDRSTWWAIDFQKLDELENEMESNARVIAYRLVVKDHPALRQTR